ncbi:MAG: polyhydroxyalkanoate depolymerase [Chloroflexi bacterium HGW-Chloroflexi-1]|nr:MAG: polyhydroxyalkanoate depolymerase [Chloroflexi bacterium HGW-Chloroflexi-1]
MCTCTTPTPFPCPEEKIPHYTAYRIDEPLQIDGRLDEPAWQMAPRSPRFVDLINGQPTIHDTRAAMLWDDDYLYMGVWVEEPLVTATLTERDAPIYTNNDIEVFIAGRDAYYEFEINALGTIYEVFFIWEEVYERDGYSKIPEFRRTNPGAQPFNGVGFSNHPRGPRLGFWNWDFPGLKSAVYVDGTLNQDEDRDRGWMVELALPWRGMKWLARADGRSLPPQDGDVWRVNFMRFNQYKEAPPSHDSGGWAWSAHGAWDSHMPECFPYIHFSTGLVGRVGK